MEIKIHHLSGSRTGEVQSFSGGEPIRMGRRPETQVKFDPLQDLVVSAVHAEITMEGENLVIRDLQSRNGTFVGSERITEKRLAPGDVVQLGADGPRLRIDFVPPAGYIPETVIVELPKMQPPGGVNRTLAMPLPAETRPRVEAPRPPVAPAAAPRRPAAPKKKNPLRALLVVFGVLFALVALAGVGAVMLRRANLKKRAQLAQKRQDDVRQAAQINQQIAKQSAQVAAQVTKLAEIQSAPQQSSSEVEDLKRQLEDSRRKLEQQQHVEDELTTRLQQTNDELASARSRPAKVITRSVPAPPPAAPAGQVSGGSVTTPAGGRSGSEVQAQAQTQNSTPSRGERGATGTTAPSSAAAATPLYAGKELRKKVAVNTAPSPVPLATLPSSTGRDLASVLAGALESTGKFVADAKGPASISVAVTNYRWDTRTSNAGQTVNNASRLSRLFGAPAPNNPVEARSTSSDAMLSLKVDLFDQAGRRLAGSQPEAEASTRSSGLGVAGVPFKQLAASDSAYGDVIRKVVADAVDELAPALQKMDWTGAIVMQQQGTAILAAGRNSGVDIGDFFDVVDSAGRVGARVKVTTVSPDTATAEVVSSTTKKLGTIARYVGSESAQQAAATTRWLVTRAKTPVLDGPGNSFKTVKTYNANTRLRFEYVVGTWAKVSESGNGFWIPLSAGRLIE